VDDGEAYFGVVSAFSPLPALPLPIVFDVDVLDVVRTLELLEELLEDPQPPRSASAAQSISVEMPLLIRAPTLA
jgi:hypothetical protein